MFPVLQRCLSRSPVSHTMSQLSLCLRLQKVDPAGLRLVLSSAGCCKEMRCVYRELMVLMRPMPSPWTITSCFPSVLFEQSPRNIRTQGQLCGMTQKSSFSKCLETGTCAKLSIDRGNKGHVDCTKSL